MFWGPPVTGAEWGADVPGSPVLSNPSDLLPLTMFFVPVRKWIRWNTRDIQSLAPVACRRYASGEGGFADWHRARSY